MRFSGILSVFIFALVLIGLQSCVQTKSARLTKKYSPEELKEDALLLNNVILEMHPGVGIYKTKDYYKNLFSEFISSLKDSMTEREFRLKTKLVLDQLHCGHTE